MPKAEWNCLYKQRKFFESIATELRFSSLDEWYNFSVQKFRRFNPSSSNLLNTVTSNRYSHSLVKALVSVYPEHDWKLWRFKKSPVNYWKEIFHQRSFFDWLGEKLGCISFESWYAVSVDQIGDGSGLLKSYNDSLYVAMTSIYPEYPWIPWRFNHVHYWTARNQRRRYFDWLGCELGYQTFECWYSALGSDIQRTFPFGYRLNGSVYRAMTDVYPEHRWIPWRFHPFLRKYLDDQNHSRRFFDWLGDELGITSFESWYKVSISDLRRQNAYIPISFSKLMTKVYPEYPWKFPRRFRQTPQPLDQSVFENVAVSDLSDWYRMPISRVEPFGITTKFELVRALKEKYPAFDWSLHRFWKPGRRQIIQWKLQRFLEETLRKKYLEISVLGDYRGLNFAARPDLSSMELDIFVPSLNLAFEYQGLQHYKDHHFFGPSKDIKLKDELKRQVCKRIGITLISVDYDLWVDEYLVMDLVRRYRPDIFT